MWPTNRELSMKPHALHCLGSSSHTPPAVPTTSQVPAQSDPQPGHSAHHARRCGSGSVSSLPHTPADLTDHLATRRTVHSVTFTPGPIRRRSALSNLAQDSSTPSAAPRDTRTLGSHSEDTHWPGSQRRARHRPLSHADGRRLGVLEA